MKPYHHVTMGPMVGHPTPFLSLVDLPRLREPLLESWVLLEEALDFGETLNGERLHRVLRPMLGLFAGRKGARRWRQVLSSASTRADAGPELIEEALAAVAPAHAA